MTGKRAKPVETSEVPEASELARLRAQVSSLQDALARKTQRERDLESRVARWEYFSQINSVWFWETDENLRYTFFSENVRELAGVPPEWHYGKTREEIGAPESISADAWNAHLETLRRHEPFEDFIYERKGPHGLQWMRSSGVPYFDEDGAFRGYRGIGSDVTDQVVTQSRIDVLSASIEQLDEIFVIWDENDCLLVCNERFREINSRVIETTEPGTPIEVHIRAAMGEGLYPDAEGREEEWIEERLRRYRNPGQPFEMERQDGQWILIHEQKVAGGATATISTDITELKKASRAEREKAAILGITFDTIPDGILVLDRNLDLKFWNDQLFSILGLDRDLVLDAANPRDAFFRMLAERGEYGEGNPDELVADRQKFLSEMKPVQFARQLSTGNWIEGRGIPMEGGEGYVTIYRDITERRRLDQMQREFVSTVSHELRTPLTSIYGSLSLIREALANGKPGDVGQLIDIAHNNTERLVGLVNDILDMDRVSAGEMTYRMEPLAMAAVVDSAVSLNAGLCEQFGVSFSVETGDDGLLVQGDADRLVQVLTNLLSNAVKYSPSGGVVEVSVERRDMRARDGSRSGSRHSGPVSGSDFRQVLAGRCDGCACGAGNRSRPVYQQGDRRTP